MKKTLIWLGAMALGVILGILGISWLNTAFNTIATIYVRLFQFLSLPIIALAIIDMVETAENVWSDSCVCAMTNMDMQKLPSE